MFWWLCRICLSFMRRFFQYRFSEDAGAFAGHPLGNIIIAGLSEMQGSTYNAMQLLSLFSTQQEKIYPSNDQPLTLHAVFKDGSEVAVRATLQIIQA